MKFLKWLWKGIKATGLGIFNFFKGVVREAKRVRWPNSTDITNNVITVVVFGAFFALFFSACSTIGYAVLEALGYFGVN